MRLQKYSIYKELDICMLLLSIVVIPTVCVVVVVDS